jgi:hypothetical protein
MSGLSGLGFGGPRKQKLMGKTLPMSETIANPSAHRF